MTNNNDQSIRTIKCPECPCLMVLKRAPYGFYYECVCGITHGAHPSGKPLGIPANTITRKARTKVHQLLERWQQSLRISRAQAYNRLSSLLKLRPADTHIGLFNLDQCNRLIQILETKLRNLTMSNDRPITQQELAKQQQAKEQAPKEQAPKEQSSKEQQQPKTEQNPKEQTIQGSKPPQELTEGINSGARLKGQPEPHPQEQSPKQQEQPSKEPPKSQEQSPKQSSPPNPFKKP
jgi:hypothetical protein